MPAVLRRRRNARKALKLARLLAALDSTAGNGRTPSPGRGGRVLLSRA
jgi:hypothetical protein